MLSAVKQLRSPHASAARAAAAGASLAAPVSDVQGKLEMTRSCGNINSATSKKPHFDVDIALAGAAHWRAKQPGLQRQGRQPRWRGGRCCCATPKPPRTLLLPHLLPLHLPLHRCTCSIYACFRSMG